MFEKTELPASRQVPAVAPEAKHSHSWRKWLREMAIAAAWALIFAVAVDIALHSAARERRPECGAAVSPTASILCPDRPKPRAEVSA